MTDKDKRALMPDKADLERTIQDAMECYEGNKHDFAGYLTDWLIQHYNDTRALTPKNNVEEVREALEIINHDTVIHDMAVGASDYAVEICEKYIRTIILAAQSSADVDAVFKYAWNCGYRSGTKDAGAYTGNTCQEDLAAFKKGG